MNSSGSKVNGESFVSEVVFKKTCLKGRRGGGQEYFRWWLQRWLHDPCKRAVDIYYSV